MIKPDSSGGFLVFCEAMEPFEGITSDDGGPSLSAEESATWEGKRPWDRPDDGELDADTTQRR